MNNNKNYRMNNNEYKLSTSMSFFCKIIVIDIWWVGKMMQK